MPAKSQKLVVRCFMMSIDGFAAGVNQRLEQPFGDNTAGFTDWLFATRSGRRMLGIEGGEENGDDPYVAHSFDHIGATILGRNMFGTSRGPWIDDGWSGWWGRTRRTMLRPSSSPSTREHRFPWTEEPPSTSPPTESTTLSNRPSSR